MMSLRKYVVGTAIVVLAGCGGNVPQKELTIDDHVRIVETTPGSEQRISDGYKSRLLGTIPEDQKMKIAESYFSSLSAEEKARLAGSAIEAKAVDVYNGVKTKVAKAYDDIVTQVGENGRPPFTLKFETVTSVDKETLHMRYDKLNSYLRR